jgi:transcriptional regulator
MYVPPHFDEARTEVLHELIRRHPFGTLVTHGAGGLDANHIPFELLPGQGALGTLSAHVARANPLWQEVADGDEVLVVFRAGDAYVSPNWYPSKHETHQQVPTWNYMVAHAHGRIVVRDDERYVRGVVARLTRTHEAAQPAPWKMGDSAPDFIDTLLQKIVGLENEITRLTGKFKLSQN